MNTDELFNNFSDGRTPTKTDFNASKMYALLEDPFSLWCTYHAPIEEAVPEFNRYEKLRSATDRKNKDEWILERYPEALFIRAENDADRFKKTLEAMSNGAQAVVGGTLWNLKKRVWGGINLLVKVESEQSAFGNYHYEILQLKRAHDIKEHYTLQMCLMNSILGDIQGITPYFATIHLKNKEVHVDYFRNVDRLNKEMEVWGAIAAGLYEPEPHKPPKGADAPWRVYANKIVAERKDLLMLPHLSPEHRNLLKMHDIKNTEEVYAAGLEKLKTLFDEEHIAHAIESYYNSMAYHFNKPVLRTADAFPPARKKHNLYFDFEATETFTKENENYVYLIGLWDKEENKFVSFVAKTKEEEEKIFSDFHDYIQNFEDTILYHWTEYEVKKMRKLTAKYPAIAEKLSKLADICFDLKISVNQAFYLPSPSFSLKAAAPAFGFHWRQDDCGAMDSMVFYTNWLKTGDSALINKVLMYNEDDCLAMLYLDDVLERAVKNNEVIIPEQHEVTPL